MKMPGLTTSLVFLAALFAAHAASAAIRSPRNATELKAVFAEADQNPLESYYVYPLHGVYDVSTVGTLKLTKGVVFLFGNPSGFGTTDDLTFSGADTTVVFELAAAAGFQPYLGLYKVAVEHGYAVGSAGGGVLVQGGFVDIEDSWVSANRSDEVGSGVFIGANSGGYIYHSLFDRNANTHKEVDCGGGMMATGGGLGVFGATASVTIVNSTFKRNHSCRGGGISLQSGGQVYMYNTSVLHNDALYEGGGVYAETDGRLDIYFSTIARNVAGEAIGSDPLLPEEHGGGGIAFNGYRGALFMAGSIIALNTVNNPVPIFPTTPSYDNSDCVAGAYLGKNPTQLSAVGVLGNIIGKRDRCNFLGSTFWFGIGTQSRPFDPQLQSTDSTKDLSYVMTVAAPVHNTAGSYRNFTPTTSPGNGNVALNCRTADQIGQAPISPSPPCSHGAIER